MGNSGTATRGLPSTLELDELFDRIGQPDAVSLLAYATVDDDKDSARAALAISKGKRWVRRKRGHFHKYG